MEEDRQCECDTGWTTTTDEEMYSPTLLRYHMCNIEVGAWNSVNKRRIKTTTILIAVNEFCHKISTKNSSDVIIFPILI